MRIVREVKAQAKHPVQLCVLAWFALGTGEQLIVGPPPGPVVYDHATQMVLLALLFVSSTVCLAGSLIKDVALGFALELWGWLGICVLFLISGYLIVTNSTNVQATATVVVFPAFIIGAGWRVVQIRRAQKRLKRIARHEIDPS